MRATGCKKFHIIIAFWKSVFGVWLPSGGGCVTIELLQGGSIILVGLSPAHNPPSLMCAYDVRVHIEVTSQCTPPPSSPPAFTFNSSSRTTTIIITQTATAATTTTTTTTVVGVATYRLGWRILYCNWPRKQRGMA